MLIIFDLDGTLFRAKSVLPDMPDGEPEYSEALLRNVRERGELFDGVFDALCELRSEGYPLAVCSASGIDYIEAALETTGIRTFFGPVRGSDGRDGKAAVFRTLAAPGEAVAVGDTWRDMVAARECGFYTVAAMYGYGKRELIVADEYVETAGELAGAVRAVIARKS